jgi:hypothetical protein
MRRGGIGRPSPVCITFEEFYIGGALAGHIDAATGFVND